MSYSTKEYGDWRFPSLFKYLMQEECLYENKIYFQCENLYMQDYKKPMFQFFLKIS